jgi:hypothetical protein
MLAVIRPAPGTLPGEGTAMEISDDDLHPRLGGCACRPSSACPRAADAQHESWGPRDRAAHEARVRAHAARVGREEAALQSGRDPWAQERRALVAALVAAGGTLPLRAAWAAVGTGRRAHRLAQVVQSRRPWFLWRGGRLSLSQAGRKAAEGGAG